MATENEGVPLSMGVSKPSTVTGAVFLSYASEDAAAAQGIATALRAAGIEVWFDKNALRGGDAWDRMIRHQIRECALFIPLVSQHSQERLEGYFRLEWKLAVDRSHRMAAERTFIVPVVVDSTRERDALVPDTFRDVQWTHLPGGQTSEVFVERVGRLLLAEDPTAQAAATKMPSGFSTVERSGKAVPSPWWSKPALWAVGAVLAVALSYFVVNRFWLSKRTAAATAGAALPSAIAPEKSIAVLPFVDLSEKHDQEYFADGMAEEVLDLLANIPGLKVIGRTSSFQFKGKNQDLRTIGEALGASYVVEGSVRKSVDRVRITAQLIDAHDGSHLWSQTYDRAATDALLMQSEIAVTLARSLEIGVGADSSQPVQRQKNDAAYDLYLRGRYAAERGDADGMATGITYLRQAVDVDPSFADAAVALAFTYYDQAFTVLAPSPIFEEARRTAKSALKLNPRLALAHAILGGIHNDYDWDWGAADRELGPAVALALHDGARSGDGRGPCCRARPTG